MYNDFSLLTRIQNHLRELNISILKRLDKSVEQKTKFFTVIMKLSCADLSMLADMPY